jgi:glycosyltransferase involved in cell wall biosynthesis
MKIAFCVYGITWPQLLRTEFYRQDYEILRSLGHEVEFVAAPWRLGGGFDLAFVWWWNYLWMWGPVAKARGLPILTTGVYDLAEARTWPAWKRLVRRWGLPFSDRDVFVSRDEFQAVPAALGLPSERVSFSPLVVDTQVYKPGPAHGIDGAPTILNIAWQRLTNLKRKKVLELLEAFAGVHRQRPDARLILAGPPEDGQALLRERASALGLGEAVLFPGELSREEKVRQMQECSIYCQVSDYEGFGLAIAEAMACGAPVLVSRVGAVPEVVGECGAYVEEISIEGIRNGLMLLLDDRRSATARADLGVARIRSEFSAERRGRDLSRLLSDLRPAPA